MKATVKCSNCGAEITNLYFTWGKRQWIWMAPLFLFFVVCLCISMWEVNRPKGDYRKDLKVTVLETRKNASTMEVLGKIENAGSRPWSGIALAADFFNPEGQFLDEESGHVPASIDPGEMGYFKITISDPPKRIQASGVRMEVKVASAYSSVF